MIPLAPGSFCLWQWLQCSGFSKIRENMGFEWMVWAPAWEKLLPFFWVTWSEFLQSKSCSLRNFKDFYLQEHALGFQIFHLAMHKTEENHSFRLKCYLVEKHFRKWQNNSCSIGLDCAGIVIIFRLSKIPARKHHLSFFFLISFWHISLKNQNTNASVEYGLFQVSIFENNVNFNSI